MEKDKIKIIVETSARHVHLDKKTLEKLFGKGYKLTPDYPLSQKGEFAAKERVILKTKKGEIKRVRIIGPLRKKTQIEISRTDAFHLKINPPLRLSGDLKNTPGITLIGPKGEVKLKQGVIIAARHIHCDPKTAKKLNLKHGDKVSVIIKGKRGLIFNNVVVRIRKNFVWRMQIDTDEANAAGIRKTGIGYVRVRP